MNSKLPQPEPPIRNPRIVAWEITRRCTLTCLHCRGGAMNRDYAGEFSTEECFKTVDAIARCNQPMIILTGGEPLMREDIFDVAAYATGRGCRTVMATCGHLLTQETAARLKASGISAVSVSLDAASAEAHDAFRGVQGAYDKTLEALACLKEVDLPFQINTTVSKLNVDVLPRILDQAVALGAATIDFFFLVPTGRGTEIAKLALDPDQRDRTLHWIATMERSAPLRIKTTCAPLYKRFRLPDPPDHPSAPFRGCMGGRGFAFISHTGILQPCGFLDVPCGDLRAADFDLARLIRESTLFQQMQKTNPFDECPARAGFRAQP